MPKLTVSSTEDLIAVVPHLVGFEVEESMVVMPLGGGPGPSAIRIDLPTSPREEEQVIGALVVPLLRHEANDVLLVGFSESRGQVDTVSRHLGEALEANGIRVHERIWAGTERWAELDTGKEGLLSPEAAERFRAQMALEGRRMPATSRAALANSLVGDPEPVNRELPALAEAMLASGPLREGRWARERAELFAKDGKVFSDRDAARMLLVMRLAPAVRDQMAADLTRANARTWQPLWDDLTRRAPGDLVTQAASLAALTAWVRGDGAHAWCALDRIPAGEQGGLAKLVRIALEQGIDPKDWDKAVVADSVPPESPPSRPAGRRAADMPASGGDRPPVGPSR